MGQAHVTVGTGTSGSKFLKNKYPVTEGLIAGENKLPKKDHLEPVTDYIPKERKVGV